MTQEEKARAYDEALERARKLYNDAKANEYKSDMEDYEYIFPELAESEDERIRRWLCDYFSSIDKAWIHKDITCIDILRWLEKQKEQKPLHWRRIEDATTQRTDDGCCVTSEKMLVKGWINDGDYRIVDEGTMVNRDILCIPVRELNAEQKSNFDIHWENGSMVCEQKEQKPAEWSEEDEKDMAHIIRILDDCYVYGTHDLSKTDHENLVNKLKSLRPSWKPSEEQMKALYDACCIAFEEERDFHPSLSRLYHDLRKL